MPKVENYNAIYTVSADPKTCMSINNYATVDKLDEALADVEKQIKNIDKKHNKKTKEVEKLYDSLNTNLLQLESEFQDETDKLTKEFRDYMQYQKDLHDFKKFCKQELKIDFDEDCSKLLHFKIRDKFYKYLIKAKIKELKNDLKEGLYAFWEIIPQFNDDETKDYYNKIYDIWVRIQNYSDDE